MKKKLHFIIGGSGSGKTTRLYEELFRYNGCRENVFLIVPEQYTMQAQKDVVLNTSCHGSMNIDVVSFMRLAYRVFEELGTNQSTVLEDHGKSMLLRRILGSLDGSFFMYNGMKDKEGFIDQIKSVLSEFYQYKIEPDDLIRLAEKAEPDSLLSYKLQDLLKIYMEFSTSLQGKYQVAEQLLSLLAQVAEQSALLKGARFFFDGFTGFTPVQYSLIEVLMKVGAEFYFTITMNEVTFQSKYCSEYNMFRLGKQTYKRLSKIYATLSEETEEMDHIVLFDNEKHRFVHNPEISHLQKHIFQYPVVPYLEETEQICLVENSNVRAEVAMTAHRIREYVCKENIRYQEIGVITGNEEEYNALIQEIFPHYEIPYYLDHNQDLMNHPYVEALRSVLDIVCHLERGFTYDRMMRYLKTGLSGVSDKAVEEMDNYLLATGTIGFSAWSNGFVKVPKKYWVRGRVGAEREKLEKCRENYLNRINQIRATVMKPVMELYRVIKEKNKVVDKAEAIFYFMDTMEYEQRLDQQAEKYYQEGDFVQSSVYGRIYGSILDLLDKMVDILGEEQMEPLEFAAILDAGLKDMGIGTVPPTMDQVICGDLTRSRMSQIQILFVLGVNDGNIPKNASSPNVLTDQDRLLLAEYGAELAPNFVQASFQEPLYIYMALTKPSKALVVSYSRMNTAGEALRPSYLIDKLKKLFPKMKKMVNYQETFLHTDQTIYGYLLPRLKTYLGRETSGEISDFSEQDEQELLAVVSLCEERYFDCLNRMKSGLYFVNQETDIGDQLARELFGDQLSLSVTRLEQFAGCPFAHLLHYGFHLQKREEAVFESTDFGTILHKVMELFGRRVTESSVSFGDLSEDELDIYATECVQESLEEAGYDFSDESARQRYMKQAILRMSKRTLKIVCRHLQLGDYRPVAFELTFGKDKDVEGLAFALPDGKSLELNGTVDRLDLAPASDESGAKVYVKVLDYKTGNMKFDITKVYYGLQLQLLTYMMVAIKEGNRHRFEGFDGTFLPGAALYYHIQDPIVEAENGENSYQLKKQFENGSISKEEYEKRQKAEKEIAEKNAEPVFRMDGVILGEKEHLDRMEHPDRLMNNKYTSIPVALKKDGSFTAASKCNSMEEVKALLQYTREEICALGTKILQGNSSMQPYEYQQFQNCMYCDYKDICHFDPRNGNRYRKLQTKSMESFLPDLENKEEKKGEE